MSEYTTQELKALPIDAGVAAKVIHQANKALHEQLGSQVVVPDWDKASDDVRNTLLEIVEEYLKERSSGKIEEVKSGTTFGNLIALTRGIVDALIPAEEKKAPKKEAEKKKDDK